jgi:biotin carboxylase
MSLTIEPVRSPARSEYISLWRRTYGHLNYGILFLGAGPLQIPGLLAAKEMGLALYVADGNPRAPGVELAQRFLPIDLKDIEALADAAAELASSGRIHGVLTIGTDFSASVAYAAARAVLPGIPYESALDASRKARMRRVFADAGLPSPGAIEISRSAAGAFRTRAWPELELAEAVAGQGLGFPLVVKPDDNMGARGVREISSESRLLPALEESLGYARSGTIVLEEKIIGREYSLDSLIDAGRLFPMGIARRHIAYPPYFIERGHSFPGDLNEQQEGELFDLLESAARALGIEAGAAKGDIFYTERGPMIGEVAARLSGGFMSGWTFPLYRDVDPAVGAIQLALGQSLVQEFAPEYFTRPGAGARPEVHERGIISIPGTVAELIPPPELETSYFFPSAAPGDQVVFPRNNVEKCGNFIAAASAMEAESAVARSLVRLEAVSPEELARALEAGYPHAYPGLLGLCARNIALIDRSMEAGESERPIAIPAEILESQERDWNFRRISDSLDILVASWPALSWQDSDWSGIPWEDVRFLTILLRGGVQASLYYLELREKFSEKEMEGLPVGPRDYIVE